VQNFINIRPYFSVYNWIGNFGVFYGWGRKESGIEAIALAEKFGSVSVLLEDGFIRSLGLPVAEEVDVLQLPAFLTQIKALDDLIKSFAPLQIS